MKNAENNPYIRLWKHLFGFHYLQKKVEFTPTVVIVFWLNGIEVGLVDLNIDKYNKQVEEFENAFFAALKDPQLGYDDADGKRN